ncbi:MAG: hypothetical protein KAJ07_05830 [Planctomycetes bacterium]|nr:hypothetical protein [Planctomycetota bacterium]
MSETSIFIPHFGMFTSSHEVDYIKEGISKWIRCLNKDVILESDDATGLRYSSSPNDTFFLKENEITDYINCNAMVIIYGANQTCWHSNIIASLFKQMPIFKETIRECENAKKKGISFGKSQLFISCLRLTSKSKEDHNNDEIDEIIMKSIKEFASCAEGTHIISGIKVDDEKLLHVGHPVMSCVKPSLDTIVNIISTILENLRVGVGPKENAKGRNIGEKEFFDMDEQSK